MTEPEGLLTDEQREELRQVLISMGAESNPDINVPVSNSSGDWAIYGLDENQQLIVLASSTDIDPLYPDAAQGS